MAKRARRRSRRSVTIPLALAAGMIPPAASIISKFPEGGWELSTQEAGRIFLGWDWKEKQFDIGWLRFGMLPVILGSVAHMVASRVGVNRALASAGIPFIRI